MSNILNNHQFLTLSNLAAITLARQEEISLKNKGKPHSEAVIAACDLFLNEFPVRERPFIERTLPPGDI